MSGLVGYGSSDEENGSDSVKWDVRLHGVGENAESSIAKLPQPEGDKSQVIERPSMLMFPAASNGVSEDHAPSSEYGLSNSAAFLGPTDPRQATPLNASAESSPSSPYTAQRAAIRGLTLPPRPNLDIPPSPPGSPTPADQKFTHFLELKKQGVHFNAKLASSSAMKNPSLLPKLMEFAGLESNDQYATNLPLDIWDPLNVPEWAYKEELAKTQPEVFKKQEAEKAKIQRETIDFVSSSNTLQSSKDGTSSTGNKATKGSAAERVMAGLDRDKKVLVQTRTEVDRRGGRNDSQGISRSFKRRKPSRSR